MGKKAIVIGSVVGRRSIRVSDVERCKRSLQFEAWKYPEDPEKYETLRGRAIHRLFEDYLAVDPTVVTNLYEKRVRKWVDALVPDGEVRWLLHRDLPEYEKKIVKFLTKKSGRNLMAGVLEIEQPVRIPLELLDLNIDLPLDVLQKYCLSGQPDFKKENQIFELKAAKELAPQHKLQAFAYALMWDVIEPDIKHGIQYLLLGDDEIVVKRNPYTTWRVWKRNPRKELSTKIRELVLAFEEIAKSETLFQPEKSNMCQYCKYFTSCLTVKKARTEWRVIRK